MSRIHPCTFNHDATIKKIKNKEIKKVKKNCKVHGGRNSS